MASDRRLIYNVRLLRQYYPTIMLVTRFNKNVFTSVNHYKTVICTSEVLHIHSKLAKYTLRFKSYNTAFRKIKVHI